MTVQLAGVLGLRGSLAVAMPRGRPLRVSSALLFKDIVLGESVGRNSSQNLAADHLFYTNPYSFGGLDVIGDDYLSSEESNPALLTLKGYTMPYIKTIALGLLATTLLAAPVGAAFAQESQAQNKERSEQSETTAMTQAKVQMAEAISAAEAAVGGKAVDTGFEENGGTAAWEVEVAQADGTTKTVLVDATTGQVDQNPKMDGEQDDNEGAENGEQAE